MAPVLKPQLHKDEDGQARKCEWDYRQVIGMLTYLHNTTGTDSSMIVH